MDNGLIFPYRQSSAHAEPGDANRLKHALGDPFGVIRCVWNTGPELVVGKRWGDAGR
jgi:hypothetical protein